MDLSIAESSRMSYGKRAFQEYHFDKVFVTLLNRQGIKSSRVKTLTKFRQTMYTNRELHMFNEVKKRRQTNQQLILMVCGNAHVKQFVKMF